MRREKKDVHFHKLISAEVWIVFYKTTLKEKVECILRTERWKVLYLCHCKCTIHSTRLESDGQNVLQLFTSVIGNKRILTEVKYSM